MSANAAPLEQNFGQRLTRRLILGSVAILLLAVLLSVASLLRIAQQLDAQALQQSRFFAEKALKAREQKLHLSVIDYAFWGEAYANLVGTVNLDWAYNRRNLGDSLYHEFGYEGVLVVDQNGQTGYALINGQLADIDAQQWLGGGLQQLLAQTRQASLANTGSVGLLLVDGQPAMVAAALLSRGGDESIPEHPQASASLLFVDILSPRKLQAMGQDYALDGLHSHPAENQPHDASLPLRLVDGTLLELDWQRPDSGQRLLRATLLPLCAAGLLILLLSGLLLRNALRGARVVERSLQHSYQALAASEERFRDVTAAASDWFWEVDAQLRLSYLSERFSQISGHRAADWLGRPLGELIDASPVTLRQWLQEEQERPLHCQYRDHAGALRTGLLSARACRSDSALGAAYRGTVSDITEELQAQQRIQHLSLHDALTDLPNRAQLYAFIGTGLTRQQSLSVLSIDLDRFKPVNDTLGHAAGDHVLREVSLRLRAATREHDLVARLGGDEFVLILGQLNRQADLDTFCRRLLERIAEPYYYQQQQIFIGASIGVARAPQDARSADELLRCADIALYQAKADGRGTWRFYAQQMNERLNQRRQLELELRQALELQQLRLHYQPRFRLDGMQLIGAEALLRWEHPRLGLLSAEQFVPLAEETGLIQVLGDWVLREACQEALHWPEQVLVSVNIGAAQFSRGDLPQGIAGCLRDTGLDPARLELEVTERVLLEGNETALATLTALKAMGLRLSMDDFGTRYSSLSCLRRYPLDGLKIDRSFIERMPRSGDDRSVIKAILALASALGLVVTAEGVESEEQLDMLRQDQCAEVQGFLLSQPQPAQALRELLRARAQ